VREAPSRAAATISPVSPSRRPSPARLLRLLLPASGVLLLLTGGGFAALEADTVDSYWRGVWWSLSLMTTVGFVGRPPTTPAGEALAAVLMVVGFLLLALTTAAVASLFVRDEELPQEQRAREFEAEALRELRALGDRLDRLEGRRQR
jgi:voltage-gated potassium channel